MRHHLKVFESIDEWIAYAKTPCKRTLNEAKRRECLGRCDRWGGNCPALLQAWERREIPEPKMSAVGVASGLAVGETERPAWEWVRRLEEGSACEVDRYLAGEERCWAGPRRRRTERRTARLLAQFGGSANWTAAQLAITAGLTMAVVEGLEAMGVATEIWFVNAVQDGRFKMCHAVKVKGSDEYLVPGLVNWLYENPAWFRGVGIAALANQYADNGRDAPWGMGSPRALECGLEDSDIIVPTVYSEAAAKEKLREILVRFGE